MTYSLILNNLAEGVLALMLLVTITKNIYKYVRLRLHPKFKENKQLKAEFRSRHKLIKKAIKNEKKA